MRDDKAHLLRSPANAARLLAALEGAHKRTGTPVSIDDLRAQVVDAERGAAEEFLRDFEAAHRDLETNDPEGWAELQKERRAFDGTLMDGLREVDAPAGPHRRRRLRKRKGH